MPAASFHRCSSLLLFFAVFASSTRPALAESTWREIRSPHFRVLTDGSEHDGRMVAHEFEQMRSAFVLLFQREEIESGAPLTIVAARNDNTFRELEPAAAKASGDNLAGLFRRHWEKQFAITRLDAWTDQNQVVVYHEYSHSILHANLHWLPTWLDEGLAEFYAYTRFEKDRIIVGAPSRRAPILRSQPLIPIATMLSTGNPLWSHDDQRAQVFYAESWAMVHFMEFGCGGKTGEKLGEFLEAIQQQVPEEKAFRDIFGDPKVFEDHLKDYLQRFSVQAGVLPAAPQADPKSFTARVLTPAETALELGCYRIGAGQHAAGRTSIEQALTLDPKLGAAHEELGFLDFSSGKDEDARKEWTAAVALDPSLPRSQFALIMTGKPLPQQSHEELRSTLEKLRHVTGLNPRFAPPFVEMAITEWRLGDIKSAYKDSRTAENLEPWRSGYRLLTGRILLKGNQPQVAVQYSRYIATHWFGSDHNEAVDLWTSVPPEKRGDGPTLVLEVPEGATVMRGLLKDIACSTGPGGTYTATLQPATPAAAAPLVLSSMRGVRIGFTDTLWWGEDHFSSCHHLAGQSALAVYKPAGPNAGTLLELDVRDDFPDAPSEPQEAEHKPAPSPDQTQASSEKP